MMYFVRFEFYTKLRLDTLIFNMYAGISLQQKILSNERVPLDVLRCYTKQMLTALDYLHSKSVVHKQLKVNFSILYFVAYLSFYHEKATKAL